MRKIKELEESILNLEIELSRVSGDLKREKNFTKALQGDIYRLRYKPLFSNGQKVCLMVTDPETGRRVSGCIIRSDAFLGMSSIDEWCYYYYVTTPGGAKNFMESEIYPELDEPSNSIGPDKHQ